MKRFYLIGYLMIAAVLVLAVLVFSSGPSASASLMGFTDTPTSEPTDTPGPPTDTPGPPTDTPEPRETLPPTNTPPSAPQATPVPVTPPAETPMGTLTLPFTGQAGVAPFWLLLAIAGGLLALGAYQLRRSTRSL